MTKLADKLRAIALAPRPFPLTKSEIRTIKLAASELAALHDRCASQGRELAQARVTAPEWARANADLSTQVAEQAKRAAFFEALANQILKPRFRVRAKMAP